MAVVTLKLRIPSSLLQKQVSSCFTIVINIFDRLSERRTMDVSDELSRELPAVFTNLEYVSWAFISQLH